MQYQSQFSEAEPAPVRAGGTHSTGEDLRDPFGQALEVARDRDRARYTVRRRNFVRRLANSTNLYARLYNGVSAVGIGGALGAVALGILGITSWNWPVPSQLAILGCGVALMVFVCLLERAARAVTRFTFTWIRRLAQAEGIELDTPPAPWHTPAGNYRTNHRKVARLRPKP